MTAIGAPLDALDSRFREIAEGVTDIYLGDGLADAALVELAYIDRSGGLTDAGHDYYMARHVRDDSEATVAALAALLHRSAIVSAFCAQLWGGEEVPVTGAVSLLKRLTREGSEQSAKRWLELMNRARLIVYNRSKPKVRVLFNPAELVSPEEDAVRERDKGHVIAPETPYGNLLALRDLLRAARKYLYWYEQHMDSKVLEVLYRELAKGSVSRLRLLSGPAHADADAKSEFRRFVREMKTRRDIDCEWRVLTKKDAQLRHDRFLLTDGISRNLPPLNLILRGSTGEILPSGIGVEDFDTWWSEGTELQNVSPPSA